MGEVYVAFGTMLRERGGEGVHVSSEGCGTDCGGRGTLRERSGRDEEQWAGHEESNVVDRPVCPSFAIFLSVLAGACTLSSCSYSLTNQRF